MRKVKISNQKLAQIVHMELTSRGYDWEVAEEYYDEVFKQEGYVIITESNDVEFLDETEKKEVKV